MRHIPRPRARPSQGLLRFFFWVGGGTRVRGRDRWMGTKHTNASNRPGSTGRGRDVSRGFARVVVRGSASVCHARDVGFATTTRTRTRE